jgi:hypothetical protein
MTQESQRLRAEVDAALDQIKRISIKYHDDIEKHRHLRRERDALLRVGMRMRMLLDIADQMRSEESAAPQ